MVRRKKIFHGEYTNPKNAWNADHYTRVSIMIKKDSISTSTEKEHLKKLAAAQGKSLSRYIIDAINAYAGETVISVLDNESKKRKVPVDEQVNE